MFVLLDCCWLFALVLWIVCLNVRLNYFMATGCLLFVLIVVWVLVVILLLVCVRVVICYLVVCAGWVGCFVVVIVPKFFVVVGLFWLGLVVCATLCFVFGVCVFVYGNCWLIVLLMG